MATSGQVNTNTTYESYFWVKWEQVGNQDIPNNRTQIKWTCGLYTEHKFYSNAIKMSAFSINGTQVYGGGTYSNFTTEGNQQIASGTMWIGHNSDGAKTFTISSFTGWLYSNHNYSSNGASYSLTTIPRHATLTAAPDFTDVQNPTITYSNPAGSAVSGVYACISLTGSVDDIAYREIPKSGGTYTFPLTEAERNVLRNATSGNSRTVMFIVRSGISGVWSNSAITKTLSIVNANPTFTSGMVSYADVNEDVVAVTENDQVIVQNKSLLKAMVGEATANKGATIKEYTLELNGVTKTLTKSGEVSFGAINASRDITLSVTAKDSRGNTTTATKTVTVTAYSKPLVVPLGNENAILCYRSDGNGNRTGNSTSLWIKAKRSYYALSGKNGCALQWRWKKITDVWNDDEKWVDLIPASSTSNEYNALAPGTFDLKTSYIVQIRAIDDIGESDIKTFEVPTQDVALHLGKGGKNVSIGTYCDYSEERTFYSEWKAIFGGGVYIGDKTLKEYIKDVINGGG